MKHDTTIIDGTDTARANGTAADAGSVAGSEGMKESANAGIRRKAMALLGLAIIAGLAAASAGLEATVAQAVETQAESTDGDGVRSGNRNHNRPRGVDDGSDGTRSSNRNHNRPHDAGENGEPTASDDR